MTFLKMYKYDAISVHARRLLRPLPLRALGKGMDESRYSFFWNEKTDVENVVTGCYAAMLESDIRERMMVWGEGRSDNVAGGRDITNQLNLYNVLRENITAMNTYTKWESFYTVINYCNTVLKYAPTLNSVDPSFTQADLKATVAEMTALRSLCYFYLIRTFRDVPFSREAFIDDDQRMDLPATPFYDVLDSLIYDLESIKGDAVTRYPLTEPRDQTGRITRDAIYAMLCEMYLWRHRRIQNQCQRGRADAGAHQRLSAGMSPPEWRQLWQCLSKHFRQRQQL